MYKKIKQFLTTYPLAKAVSFLLAFILWFYINAGVAAEAEFDVPLQMDNLSEKLVHIGEEIRITVKVQGTKENLLTVNSNKIRVRCSLADAKKGQYTVKLSKANVSVPDTVEVMDITPKEVILNLQSLK